LKPTALDAPTDQLDNDEQHFVGIIREHGWFHTHVLGDEEGPGFDYTTGFQIGLGHPEIITFDMKKDVAATVFWDLYRSIGMGNKPAIGELLHELTMLPLSCFRFRSPVIRNISVGAAGSTAVMTLAAFSSFGPIAMDCFHGR